MGMYYLTVFEKNGEKLLDESYEAANDQEAKVLGTKKLEEKNYTKNTHRCVNAAGKMILFER
ncbi:YhzD family protein [Metabacillus sp. 84]|uniref:YhzD family protein n=1 Tax=Metabacillus sp. 84 TaxID=3404705 RepID=UPI003CF8A67C